MEKKVRVLTIVFLISLICFFPIVGSSVSLLSVPVVPNESVIKGVVSEYAILSSRIINIRPDQVLYRLTIYIESSESIGNKPDFLSGREGQDIRFYTKKRLSPELFGKKIKAKVRYRGDERGGTFWIRNIEIIR